MPADGEQRDHRQAARSRLFWKNERKGFLSKLKSYVLLPPNHHAIHCHIPKIEQIEKRKREPPICTTRQTARQTDSRSECVKNNNNNNNNNYYYYYNNNCVIFITHTLQAKVWWCSRLYKEATKNKRANNDAERYGLSELCDDEDDDDDWLKKKKKKKKNQNL